MKRPATKPKTRTYTKTVANLTTEEVHALRRLRNTHGGTRIISDLSAALRYPTKGSQVVMVKELGTKRILSWGLIDRTECPETLQLYTHGSYRRMGFGARVVAKAKQLVGRDEIRHWEHDDRAEAFFKSVNLKNYKVKAWLAT